MVVIPISACLVVLAVAEEEGGDCQLLNRYSVVIIGEGRKGLY